jgi:hypothetical protein
MGGAMAQGQPGKRVSKTPSQQISQAWWHAPVIPAVQDAVERKITIQDQPGQKKKPKTMRPYLKNN